MPIFFHELRAHRKSLIFWSLGMLFMVAAGMGKFQGYANSGQSVNELFSDMPPGIQSLFGLSTFDLTTASGFYGVLFLYLIVLATIHAALLGANIIAKEEQDRTTEFLLVKPISRYEVISAKLLAGLVNITILNVVTLFSSLLIVGAYNEGTAVTVDILKLMLGLFMVQLIYLSLGAAIAALSKKAKSTGSAAAGIVLATFLLGILIDLNDTLTNLKYFTPYKYFEAKNIMYGGSFEPVFVILSALLIIMLLGTTYSFYQKKDLNI